MRIRAHGALTALFIAGIWAGDTDLLAQDDSKRSFTVRLNTPQGDLPFQLELTRSGQNWVGHIVNGVERITIPKVSLTERKLLIDIPHYDSRITLQSDGKQWSGEWVKRRGKEWATVQAQAAEREPIDWEQPDAFLGRWAVQFESDQDPAVAVFERGTDRRSVQGTFLTTTGDYRYLVGGVVNGELQLSCFDGAHAFLFRAIREDSGKLRGRFQSGNWWSTLWTAHRDANASLPDAFEQTVWTNAMDLSELSFPDLDGEMVALDDPSLAGKCKIIEVFGSWCPNCHDAALYLSELHDRYGDRGLSIVGLAFELTGDFERDVQQVRHFIERNQTRYPMLIAGTSDKAVASEILPVLDRVRSYPTMIFLDANDKVIAIYTGFSGPATGEAHHSLRRQFEQIIEKQLDN